MRPQATPAPPNGAKPREAYSLEVLPGGIVRLQMNTRLMHLEEARPLCGDLEGASSPESDEGGGISLVVDVARVGLATPAAALHGFMTLRHIRIDSIALVRAKPAMRRVATLMLRAARFPRFGFFDDEEAAVAWLQAGPGAQPGVNHPQQASPPAAPTPSGRRRAATRLAAGVTAAALAGGLVAARRRNGHRPGRGALRGIRAGPSRRSLSILPMRRHRA